MSDTEVRAEWVRALAFMLSGLAFALMAAVDPRDQTAAWLLGLAVAAVAVVALLGAAFRIASGRELFAALAGRRPTMAARAIVDLNRIPAAPVPHRRPRLIARVSGPLSGVAALVMLVRLATL